MTLSIKDVEHVAKLARLELSEADKEKFTVQLASILNYVETLSEIDTKNVAPMLSSSMAANFLRKDELVPSIEHEEIMRNAPDREGNFFKVKKVIE